MLLSLTLVSPRLSVTEAGLYVEHQSTLLQRSSSPEATIRVWTGGLWVSSSMRWFMDILLSMMITILPSTAKFCPHHYIGGLVQKTMVMSK